jgi:hypothetical protein
MTGYYAVRMIKLVVAASCVKEVKRRRKGGKEEGKKRRKKEEEKKRERERDRKQIKEIGKLQRSHELYQARIQQRQVCREPILKADRVEDAECASKKSLVNVAKIVTWRNMARETLSAPAAK